MAYSNHFPIGQKKVEHLHINERIRILFEGLKENCPELYDDIKSRNNPNLTKITIPKK